MSIKAAYEKLERVFINRPSAAKSASITHVQLESGTRCEITQGNWHMVSDQSPQYGGNNDGPNPGFLGRGALGACLAQGYAICLARRQLTFRSIDIEVEGEIDARGFLGMDETIPPGNRKLSFEVKIQSDEDEDAILAALDHADRHSPWLYNLANAVQFKRGITIKSSRG